MSLFVSVGMWLERFVIIVTSLAPRLRALVVGHVLPDALGLHDCTAGTFGLFLTLFLLFLRFVPMISIFEVKTLLPQGKVKAEH